MALNPTLPAEAAVSFDRTRKSTPFATIDAIANQFPVVASGLLAQNTTVTSQYFLVTTDVTIDGQHLTLLTMLVRTEKEGKPVVTTLWQSRGTQ